VTDRPRPMIDWQEVATPPANDKTSDPLLAYVEVSPEAIAFYVTCHCGMSPLEFISWLAKEVDFLIEMDGCSK
jgi:hypothetical protein